MENTLIAMATFAWVGAATPGPVNLLATSTAVTSGSREAMKHVFGASAAYAFVVLLSGSLMQQLLTLLPQLAFVMQVIGSVYLFYLAYNIYTAPVSSIQVAKPSRSGFLTGATTQLINPKAWTVALSGVSIFVVGSDDERLLLFIFTTVSFVICLLGVGLWAAIGTAMASTLEKPSKQRNFNRLMSALLTTAVILMWLQYAQSTT